MVTEALGFLARDFADVETVGPLRVAEFEGATAESDAVAADAHGYVADLLELARPADGIDVR